MRYAKPFIIFVLCTLFSMQSFAQTKTSKEKVKQALALIRDANDDLENKDYKYALEGYKEAYALYPTAILLYRMALSNDKLGNKAEAISLYNQYLASKKPSDKLKALSEARVTELEGVKTVSVSIKSDPSGAEIYSDLDGESLGETPRKVELGIGKQTLYLKLKGHEVYKLTTTVTKGKETTEDVKLVAKKADLLVMDPDEDIIEDEEPSESGIMTTLGWTSIAVGGALIVGGGTFSLLSSSKENEANNYNKRGDGANPTELNDLRDSAIGFSDISTILFISGGVLAAGGIALIVLDSGSERETAVNILPLKGGAAVGFSSTF